MASYSPRAIEEFYQAWARHRKLDPALEELRRQYPSLSRPTLKKYRDELEWEERAAKADAFAQRLEQEANDVELALLSDLKALAEKKSAHLRTTKSLDNQDLFAYLKIANQISQITNRRRTAEQKIDKPALFLELLEVEIKYLTEQGETELVEALAQHLDGMGKAIEAQFGG